MAVDPLADQYPSLSAYNYVANNPLRLVDPDGRSGCYYDDRGRELGCDGIDDDKAYVAQDGQRRSVKRALEGGDVATAQASSVELPAQNVRQEMVDAHSQATPFNEEGGIIVATKDGGQDLVRAKPGQPADPSVDPEASVDVYDAADPSDWANATAELGKFHTHPSGSIRKGNMIHSFGQPPSKTDISNASGGPLNDYVLSNKVYIYNGNGVIATFPLKRFVNPSRK